MCVSQSNSGRQTTSLAVLLFISGFAVHIAADTSSEDVPKSEEGTISIDVSSKPAAPPDSAEARIALRQHRESVPLNRFTFPGNVLKGTGDIVDHWIVMFCPGWHDKCQGLMPSYELLGVQWENKLNKAVMSSSIRFAKVDCATEKALCVSLDIDDYPSVVHYRNQQRVNSWHGGAPGLVRFVKEALEGPRRRPRPRAAAQAKSCASDSSGPPIPDTSADGSQRWITLRLVCLSLMLLAATRCIWMLITSSISSRKIPPRAASATSGTRDSRCVMPRTSLEACLPQEWARERSAIIL